MKRPALLKIHLAGGAAVLTGLLLAAWFGLLNHNSAATQLHDIIDQQINLQSEHSRLQKQIGRCALEWERLKEQAQEEGNLDNQEPPEVRLRSIRRMAERHGWNDVGIMPVQWRRVADVAEQTFSVTAEASFEQFMLFMKEFEESPIWADVSHLNVRGIPKQRAEDAPRCKLEITLNFYSSFETESQAL